jgi:hypothetical protein
VLERATGLLRPALLVFVLSALFGAASKLDDFLVLFLRQDSGESFLPAFSRNFEFFGAFLGALGFSVVGCAFAAACARLSGRPVDEGLALASRPFATLSIPCALTAASVASLSISPVYPYGLGLVLSLDLEGWFKPLLTAAIFAASLARTFGVPDFPRLSRWSSALILVAALFFFTLATPRNFYQDGAGQGNMFKYLRMAQAMARSGSLDIEKADENPDASLGSFLSQLPRLAADYIDESRKLLRAIAGAAVEGRIYTGEMKARRANRSMFRSEDGGIYYINAPGPGLLLVPAVLADRALNRAFGWNRQVAVILFWQFLAALLVLEMFLSVADVAGRAAALVSAFTAALIVPLLFYSFQIYPELPAALLLLFAFRKLVIDSHPTAAGALASGVALAALPWLHQKYSVAALVLGLLGISRFFHRRVGRFALEGGKLALFSLPLLLSAYSVFLFSHALTGSLSPTATFDAVARTSFAPRGLPKGFLGLFFDRENGLFVFAPFYLLALVGLPALWDRQARIAKPLVLVVLSYLLVIASFPYWPGAVSTMGRYISSILPLLVLPAALVVKRAFEDGILAGAAILLGTFSLAVSASFASDLVPSWQPELLWSRVLYCDPMQYLPNFVSDGILGSGPVHVPKLLAQLLAVSALLYWLRHRVSGLRGFDDAAPTDEAELIHFPRRIAAGAGALLAGILALAALMERFPGNPAAPGKPSFRETRVLGSGREVSVEGEHGFEGDGVWVPGRGSTRFVLLSREPAPSLVLSFSNGPGENVVEVRERGSATGILDLPPSGPHERTLLLRKPYRFDGPRGERFLYVFDVRSRGSFVPAEAGSSGDRRRLGTYVTVR